MKKIIAALLLIGAISCNSNSSNTKNADSTDLKQPVQNVNGNIPDTTQGASDITGKQKIDTTKIDSSRLKK